MVIRSHFSFTIVSIALCLGVLILLLSSTGAAQAAMLKQVETGTQTLTLTPSPTPTLTAALSTPTLSPTQTAAKTVSAPRVKTMTVDYTAYLWWLVDQATNKAVCEFSVDHPDLPTLDDIYGGCGKTLYNAWVSGESCNGSNCNKLYLYAVESYNAQKKTSVTVPPPSAWLSLQGCVTEGSMNLCDQSPSLVIKGEEPMEGETIVNVHWSMDGVPHECDGATCIILLTTLGDSIRLQFWVDSSLGDSSRHFSALVRKVTQSTGDSSGPSATPSPQWLVEVASSQWQGSPPAACADTWESLPDSSGPPAWLSNVGEKSSIQTQNSYYYLAGQLILSGAVDAKDCPGMGMQTSVTANTCGVDKASTVVKQWQNQFDAEIMDVSTQSSIPAPLLKNIIGQESQFWPGVYSDTYEVGLGQLTGNGADTLLMWNPDFFTEFCPNVFNQTECSKGYNNLSKNEKGLVKGALLQKVNISCSNCLDKLDPDQVRFSIDVLASGLKANCEQAGQVVYNLTGEPAGVSSSYVDLWKFTLVNYNAGSGCLQDALTKTKKAKQPLTWKNVSSHLQKACQGAITYVQNISNSQ